MIVYRSITEPLRSNPNWNDCWGTVGLGLITSWERGRELSTENQEIALKAINNELVMLPWKGGFNPPKVIKKLNKNTQRKIKYGVFNYLAMWQGLRGENLDIDVDRDIAVTCNREKKIVIFTSCYKKYAF